MKVEVDEKPAAKSSLRSHNGYSEGNKGHDKGEYVEKMKKTPAAQPQPKRKLREATPWPQPKQVARPNGTVETWSAVATGKRRLVERTNQDVRAKRGRNNRNRKRSVPAYDKREEGRGER